MAQLREQNAFIVVDLGYGDAGKGTLVDFLTRQHHAHTVIRFNGGSQAAHNVVTPDGRHHTFAQFGSGMFVPGVKTMLSEYMLIEPFAMFNEADHLQAVGVRDGFARTLIDRRARVITPYHIAANRLRELARGDGQHGSCGMGVGETVSDWIAHPDLTIYAGDLPDSACIRRKLALVRDHKWAEIAPLIRDVPPHPLIAENERVFHDLSLIEACEQTYAALAESITLTDEDDLHVLVNQPGCLIFEGAQGVLLDEEYGFHPYTTWSNTTFENAVDLLDSAGYSGARTRLGVLRTYHTRHGAGPFVTEDTALAPLLHEAHNGTSDWQGGFRFGWFDAVAARYALDVVGGIDGLALTHMDQLDLLPMWNLCEAYTVEGQMLTTLPKPIDLAAQSALTAQLLYAEPVYRSIARTADYAAEIAQALGVRMAITSHGRTALDKRVISPVKS